MDSALVYRQFGKLVREHRQRLGLRQDQVGEAVGLSRTSITNIEQGRQKVLLHQVFLLAESLQVNPEALLPEWQTAGVAPHIEQKLPKHLTGPEKEWVCRIVVSGSKGGGSDAKSKR